MLAPNNLHKLCGEGFISQKKQVGNPFSSNTLKTLKLKKNFPSEFSNAQR